MFEDTVSRFDRIHERDRQTHRHTDAQTPHDGMRSIARQKLSSSLL